MRTELQEYCTRLKGMKVILILIQHLMFVNQYILQMEEICCCSRRSFANPVSSRILSVQHFLLVLFLECYPGIEIKHTQL